MKEKIAYLDMIRSVFEHLDVIEQMNKSEYERYEELMEENGTDAYYLDQMHINRCRIEAIHKIASILEKYA